MRHASNDFEPGPDIAQESGHKVTSWLFRDPGLSIIPNWDLSYGLQVCSDAVVG